MKKFPGTLIILITILALSFTAVSANAAFTRVKGIVTEIEEDIVTVEAKDGETYQVHVPEYFDLESLEVDDVVMTKLHPLADGTWQAVSFHILEEDEDEGDEDEEEDEDEDEDDQEEEDKGEGTRLNAAFCNAEKKDIPHPLAVTLAADYGVDESWVMDHYCNGKSIGEIRLALKTSTMDGVEVDADTLLEMRDESSWGQIWQELGLKGKDREKTNNGNPKDKDKVPPGQLKKEEKAKDKDN